MTRPRTGMTLSELLIVVVVVGILAAVAIPSYTKAIERSYRRQAQDLLLTIYDGERVYFFSENEYKGGLRDASPSSDWRAIFTDNPNFGGIPVTFKVDAFGPPATFLATAMRNGSGATMSITEQRDWCGVPGNNDPSNCPGWPP